MIDWRGGREVCDEGADETLVCEMEMLTCGLTWQRLIYMFVFLLFSSLGQEGGWKWRPYLSMTSVTTTCHLRPVSPSRMLSPLQLSDFPKHTIHTPRDHLGLSSFFLPNGLRPCAWRCTVYACVLFVLAHGFSLRKRKVCTCTYICKTIWTSQGRPVFFFLVSVQSLLVYIVKYHFLMYTMLAQTGLEARSRLQAAKTNYIEWTTTVRGFSIYLRDTSSKCCRTIVS